MKLLKKIYINIKNRNNYKVFFFSFLFNILLNIMLLFVNILIRFYTSSGAKFVWPSLLPEDKFSVSLSLVVVTFVADVDDPDCCVFVVVFASLPPINASVSSSSCVLTVASKARIRFSCLTIIAFNFLISSLRSFTSFS